MTLHKTGQLDLTASAEASKDRGRAFNDLTDEEVSENFNDDDEYDNEDWDPTPSFEEDMAKNAGKTRKEIMYARRLWASGMIEIYNKAAEALVEHGDGACRDFDGVSRLFVAKAPICAIAKRFQELLSAERSWPIIDWSVLVEENSFDAWRYIDAILRFVYRGEFHYDHYDHGNFYNSSERDIVIWCQAMRFQCPKLQNETMKAIMKRDAATEKNWENWDGETAIGKLAFDCLWMMDRIGAVHTTNGEFEPHKLMSYFVDKLIWDAMNGGYLYLTAVHIGGLVANMVARAHVDAAKKPKPPFAPWHVFNRHRYLMNEDVKADKKRPSGNRNSEKSTKKHRIS